MKTLWKVLFLPKTLGILLFHLLPGDGRGSGEAHGFTHFCILPDTPNERKVFPDKGLSSPLHSSYPHMRQDVVFFSDIFVNTISTSRKLNNRQNPT